MRDLNTELLSLSEFHNLINDNGWAQRFYATICCNTFWHEDNQATPWECDWREACSLIVTARKLAGCPEHDYKPNRCSEDYIYWYSLTDDGSRDSEVVNFLLQFGWMTLRK
jgi:hypothetical protein